MARDWFRNTAWSERIERAFLDKLKRSRTQRDQQVAIQAITLTETRPDAALKLAQFYFETRKSKFDDARVHSAVATAKLNLGDLDGALAAYRSVLEAEEVTPGVKTNAFVEYPYLVATRGVRAEYERALAVLDANADEIVFPVVQFMWSAAYALIAASQGRRALAKEHAATALQSADKEQSGFRYHKALGLVGEQHEYTIKRLRAVA